MCLEIYSRTQPVQIPYENERIRFLSPTSISSRYTLLVRNAGYEPIRELLMIYPRSMLQMNLNGSFFMFEYLHEHSLEDVTAHLHTVAPFSENSNQPGEDVSIKLPDPNNPVGYLPGLTGQWCPGATIEPVYDFGNSKCRFLSEHHFMAWKLKLSQEIEPQAAQWLSLEVKASGLGCPIPTLMGSPQHPITAVFHELSSPIDVRRTISETLHTALRDASTSPLAEHETHKIRDSHKTDIRQIIYDLGLNGERQVDIQYYELSIQPGNPQERFTMDISRTGDIRPRSGSPRVGNVNIEQDREFVDEPIYEFKSGSILEPAHPWRNTGFSLRMTLLCREFLSAVDDCSG